MYGMNIDQAERYKEVQLALMSVSRRYRAYFGLQNRYLWRKILVLTSFQSILHQTKSSLNLKAIYNERSKSRTKKICAVSH
jgi:hypothetical protein